MWAYRCTMLLCELWIPFPLRLTMGWITYWKIRPAFRSVRCRGAYGIFPTLVSKTIDSSPALCNPAAAWSEQCDCIYSNSNCAPSRGRICDDSDQTPIANQRQAHDSLPWRANTEPWPQGAHTTVVDRFVWLGLVQTQLCVISCRTSDRCSFRHIWQSSPPLPPPPFPPPLLTRLYSTI